MQFAVTTSLATAIVHDSAFFINCATDCKLDQVGSLVYCAVSIHGELAE